MKATIRNKKTGEIVEVKSSTENNSSSYGQAVWEDSEGLAYFQIGMQNPFYEEVSVSPENDLQLLWQFLHNKRASAGISIRKLADECGLNKDTIVNVENGNNIPRLDIITTIINALGAKLSITLWRNNSTI